MILGVLNEHPDNRVALVPQVAKKIKDLGIEIVIEKEPASAPDLSTATIPSLLLSLPETRFSQKLISL
jgi:alanine dehydrogenase